MIETLSISRPQLAELKKRTEGHFFDFKAREIAPAKVTKIVSAFQNADGGEVWIGLTDPEKENGEWVGYPDQEAANGLLQALEGTFGIGNYLRVEFVSCEGQRGLCVHLEVEKSHGISNSSDGVAYVRRGAYSINDAIHIQIFNNRIEIISPGRLPAHITPQNILSERFARNPTIVRVLNKFPEPPNQDIGEGLNTAFEAMKKLSLRAPEVTDNENRVVITLRHERLASPELAILQHLVDTGTINNSKARQITGIGSENKVKNIFNKMMDVGLIEKNQGKLGNKTSYKITAKGKNQVNQAVQV